MQLLSSITSRWWALPLAGRGLMLVVCVVLVYFVWTSTRSGSASSSFSSSRGRSGSAPRWGSTPVGAAAAKLVRDAASAAKDAGSAKTPYEQYLRLQWGISTLKAARLVAEAEHGEDGAESALSMASSMHVGRLGDYLTKAQALCGERIEAAAAASKSEQQ